MTALAGTQTIADTTQVQAVIDIPRVVAAARHIDD